MGAGQKLRIDKIISHLGIATRSETKKLAKAGLIKVNGAIVKDTSVKVNPEQDRLEVDGQPIHYREHIYIMLNKPAGVISATEDVKEQTVVDLLPDVYRAFEPFPVGRLDKDTEGLLLLTNDGRLAHQLLSPKKHVPKVYYAEVSGLVDEADKQAFKQGVALDDGYVTMPAELTVLETNVDTPDMQTVSKVLLKIYEGKFHQVKRMFQAVGKKVTYLKRIRMGSLELDTTLAPGQYRELTKTEIESLTEGTGDEL